jgi:hypothetical protein
MQASLTDPPEPLLPHLAPVILTDHLGHLLNLVEQETHTDHPRHLFSQLAILTDHPRPQFNHLLEQETLTGHPRHLHSQLETLMDLLGHQHLVQAPQGPLLHPPLQIPTAPQALPQHPLELATHMDHRVHLQLSLMDLPALLRPQLELEALMDRPVPLLVTHTDHQAPLPATLMAPLAPLPATLMVPPALLLQTPMAHQVHQV